MSENQPTQAAKDYRVSRRRRWGRNPFRDIACRAVRTQRATLYPRSIIELADRLADHQRNSHFGRIPDAELRRFAAGIPPAELCMDDPPRFPWPAPVRPGHAEAV